MFKGEKYNLNIEFDSALKNYKMKKSNVISNKLYFSSRN